MGFTLTAYGEQLVEMLKAQAMGRADALAEAAALCREADREWLGRAVRSAWVLWAGEQPSPKESWLLPWEELGEADKEADRRIGEAIAQVLAARIEALGGGKEE